MVWVSQPIIDVNDLLFPLIVHVFVAEHNWKKGNARETERKKCSPEKEQEEKNSNFPVSWLLTTKKNSTPRQWHEDVMNEYVCVCVSVTASLHATSKY